MRVSSRLEGSVPTLQLIPRTLDSLFRARYPLGTAVCRISIPMPQPHTAFVATERSTVQTLVHAPQGIESACERRVRVVRHAITQRGGAHAGSLAYICRHVYARRCGELSDGCFGAHLIPLRQRAV